MVQSHEIKKKCTDNYGPVEGSVWSDAQASTLLDDLQLSQQNPCKYKKKGFWIAVHPSGHHALKCKSKKNCSRN